MKGGEKVQKKHLKTVQMLMFTIIFTLAVIGAASAVDDSSNNLAAVNVDQATEETTQSCNNVITNNYLSNSRINSAHTAYKDQKPSKKVSSNVNNAYNSATYHKIWNGGHQVSRGVNNCHMDNNRVDNHGSCIYTCKCQNHVKDKANVVMTKTSNGPVNVGQTGVYTITLINNGPDAAKNIKVTDPLPDGFSLGSISAGSYDGTVWTIPSLDNGAIATLTFTRVMTSADIGTTKTNTATETQCTCNPNPVTPQTATIYTNKAVLSLTKTTTKSNYNVGDTAVYNIDVLNNGPDTATNVVVTDTLPVGLTYLSSTFGGVYDAATRTVTWTVASLDNGVHFLATVSATVTADAAAKTLTNNLQVKNDQMVDPVSTTASIHVPSAALELTKTVNTKTPKIGDTVIYTLIVQNHGPDAATSVKVTEVVPTGLKFVGVDSVNYGTYDPNTGVWTIGNLPANEVAKLVLRFTAERAGIVINQAKVTSLTYDPNLYPTEASVTINVQQPEPVDPIPTVGAKTVTMQHTGLPIGALILAVIMLFTGIVLPRRKN